MSRHSDIRKNVSGVNPIKLWFFSFFRFMLLSLSVCRTGKYCLYIKMAKRNSKKWKKSSFYKEKSLVWLTPGEKKNGSTLKVQNILQVVGWYLIDRKGIRVTWSKLTKNAGLLKENVPSQYLCDKMIWDEIRKSS